ncbi:MAG: SDR family oxidoreductase [Anaerolineae bacterium]|jgi:NAD(P)-dependent dehydrogenase (short-subunit alcohol dehydrogenase family)|nr:SDR family oxidoreductase [Anaerolineae bacterium]MBT7069953.1 SDR family oxidoreductase [Anaerolineae bacterium]MBT7326489.1 SDR family oxidoreductase [Anaerolineae bacterium]
MQLEGKRIVMTGGASGIGAATVLAFAKQGAAVISTDVQDEAGKAVVAEAAKLGVGPIKYMHCDVSNQDEVNQVFDTAVAELGGLDVMANLAGVEKNVAAEDVNEAEIDFIMNVHVKGTMYTNAAAFRYMKDTGGSIINYTSLAGISGFPGIPIYGAAKGAVLGWTRNVAKDWGQYKIRTNAVAPFVMTPMAQLTFDQMSEEAFAGVKAWFQMMVPLGGWLGDVEDSANVNIFLASDASKFITGQTISVDGGFVMVR